MLIEFIGCSGAGKTTLANRVSSTLTSLGHVAAYSRDVVARSTCTHWVSNERLRNVLLNGILLPWFAGSSCKHRAFYRFVVPRIHKRAENTMDRINRLRSTMRLISGDELLRKKEKPGRLTLVDEGAMGSAHNAFAFPHVESLPEQEDLMEFAAVVPAPDVIIHVDAPSELAFQRIRQRGGFPIRRGLCNRRLQNFLAAGRATFEGLASCREFGDRVLTIANGNNNADSVEESTRRIVDFILGHADCQGSRPRQTGLPLRMHTRKEFTHENRHLQQQ